MCGRYQLTSPIEAMTEHYNAYALAEVLDLPPRYNVAPTMPVPIVVRYAEAPDRRSLTAAKWGLIPFWAKDEKIGSRMINARAEEAAEKPAYRAAMKYRRCIVPADGFYEWRAGTTPKQPFLIRRRDRKPLAFAGLWELWRDELQSCAVLTTSPNETMAPIHNRMPVILEPADFDRWLDPQQRDPAAVRDLLKPAPADVLEAVPVSTYVNSPKNEGPMCIESMTG